jgi:hypothetical protein
MSVWFAFVVDQVRSMAVTASAWQSLVVAWGNPSNFLGKVIFPVMTVPLTGLGEFPSSVLPLTYQTIDRIMRSANILFLVRRLEVICFSSLTPFGYQADMDPTKRLQSLSTDRGLNLLGMWLSSCQRRVLTFVQIALLQLSAAVVRGVVVRESLSAKFVWMLTDVPRASVLNHQARPGGRIIWRLRPRHVETRCNLA